MPSHSTVWSGVLSQAEEPLEAGVAICKNGDEFVIATSANRALYGRAVGVSLTAATRRVPSFEYQVAGVIAPSLSGLASGSESWVRVASDGSLERCTPADGDDLIGRCNAAGDLTLSPSIWSVDVVSDLATFYEIDFIRDCGADPTGTNDCSAALNTAITLALAKLASPAYAAANDFTLHVPPGVYKFTTTCGVKSLAGISTFRIVGHRSASIFLLAGAGATNAPLLGCANQVSFEMEGITFLSHGTTSTADVDGLLDINSSYLTTFRSVHVRSVVCEYYGILTEGFGSVRFIDCYGDNSACKTSTGGIWTADGAKSVIFENFTHVDPGQINGVAPGGGANRLGPHVNTIMVRGAVRHVAFRNTFVDEGAINCIKIGDGTSQIGTVEASGLFINPPTLPGKVAGLYVRKARRVIVRGLDHSTHMTVPMVKLETVDRADIENVQKHTGSTTYVITADANCKYLRVADPDGFAAVDISAHASIPTKFVDVHGVETPL